MDVRLDPMTPAEYATYRETADAGYAAALASSGRFPEAEAREQAATQMAELLPDGFETLDHHFFTARDGDREVGILWLRIRDSSGQGGVRLRRRGA